MSAKNIPERNSSRLHDVTALVLGNKGSLEEHSLPYRGSRYSATCCSPSPSQHLSSRLIGARIFLIIRRHHEQRTRSPSREEEFLGLSSQKYIKLYTGGPLQRIFLSVRHSHPSTPVLIFARRLESLSRVLHFPATQIFTRKRARCTATSRNIARSRRNAIGLRDFRRGFRRIDSPPIQA